MNTLVKAIVLSISTALVTAPVMAAPQDHYDSKRVNDRTSQIHQDRNDSHNQVVSKKHEQTKRNVTPSKDWKIGHQVPQQYQSQTYKFNYATNKRLSKPGQQQHWVKVNGDYILVNDKNHKIIKIVKG